MQHATHPTMITFMVMDVMALNDIFTIFSLADLLNL